MREPARARTPRGARRRDAAWHGMARHGVARQGKARQGKARRDGTGRDGTGRDGTGRDGARRRGMTHCRRARPPRSLFRLRFHHADRILSLRRFAAWGRPRRPAPSRNGHSRVLSWPPPNTSHRAARARPSTTAGACGALQRSRRCAGAFQARATRFSNAGSAECGLPHGGSAVARRPARNLRPGPD
ncbi:hypothetical protein BOC55_09115 [Burkholderia pseudomallei]|nr:hypothetical protein BOC48_08195 [Burkholderia pseudomallei]ARL73618.1 hypothetical protein BOC54_15530 [Burkholderia pseudomallei]ARL79471.1 hypothetical protein BOC55_09115 [Burkholderia pseudomallei]